LPADPDDNLPGSDASRGRVAGLADGRKYGTGWGGAACCFCQTKPRPVAREYRAHLGLKNGDFAHRKRAHLE